MDQTATRVNPAANAAGGWHAAGIDEVRIRLQAPASGLTAPDAEQRLARYGPNGLPEAPPPPVWRALLAQFTSPLVLILVIAAGVTLLLGEFIDTTVIAAVVVLNAAIGFTQERRAERSVRSLMTLLTPHARVVRDGVAISLPSRDLVPGDLVLLESGDRVPADLRLADATALSIDESLLTGESLPVRKATGELPASTAIGDRSNMAFAGSIVVRGRGRGVVVATGSTTELGAIAGEMHEVRNPPTPLEARLARFARTIGIVVTLAAVAAFALGVASGERPSEMFTTAVALAVATVPEGLPVAFTITMTIGVRRMARRRAIVRWLPAVEALGSTTVIGSDKTGTLTLNRMSVRLVWTDGRLIDLESTPPGGATGDDGLRRVLVTGAVANEAQLLSDGAATGDPTEVALLRAAAQSGLDPGALQDGYRRLADLPFEPERQFSAALRERAGRRLLFVKGAPERVLAMCGNDTHGAALDHEAAQQAARTMADGGLRVLAMAVAEEPAGSLESPRDLTFLGLQAMADPIRPGAREAIARCRQAGIRVVMITGDHAVTARAIASELGLPAERVLTGGELAAIPDAAFAEAVAGVSVFARVSPEQKLAIVRALEAAGEVVAVTGDGVNDAPALRAAAIGIAMGERGTDVAKEAADMVLADDDFVSIAAAVEEGRVTFANIRNVTFFLLSTNGGELIVILAALLLGWPLPLLAAQILWLNLVTDSLQVVGIAFEPGDPNAMRHPPRPAGEGILPRMLWERVGLSSLVMAAATLGLFWWERERGASLETARTVALTTMVLFQTVQAFNARSADRSLFRTNPLSNRILLAAALGALAIHVIAILAPPLRYLLRVEPLGWEEWLRATLASALILVVVELHKLLRRPAL